MVSSIGRSPASANRPYRSLSSLAAGRSFTTKTAISPANSTQIARRGANARLT